MAADPEQPPVGRVLAPLGDRRAGHEVAIGGASFADCLCELAHVPQAVEQRPRRLGPLELHPSPRIGFGELDVEAADSGPAGHLLLDVDLAAGPDQLG